MYEDVLREYKAQDIAKYLIRHIPSTLYPVMYEDIRVLLLVYCTLRIFSNYIVLEIRNGRGAAQLYTQ